MNASVDAHSRVCVCSCVVRDGAGVVVDAVSEFSEFVSLVFFVVRLFVIC
jgi:hypothetical protein